MFCYFWSSSPDNKSWRWTWYQVRLMAGLSGAIIWWSKIILAWSLCSKHDFVVTSYRRQLASIRCRFARPDIFHCYNFDLWSSPPRQVNEYYEWGCKLAVINCSNEKWKSLHQTIGCKPWKGLVTYSSRKPSRHQVLPYKPCVGV